MSYQDNNSAGNSVQTGSRVNGTRDWWLDLGQLMRSETDHASQGFRLIESPTMPISLIEGGVMTGVIMMDQLNESSDLGEQEEDKPESFKLYEKIQNNWARSNGYLRFCLYQCISLLE